jgi:hypothetical protein
LQSSDYYCVFDNVGPQTVTDVVDSSTYTPTRTVATYECTNGYGKKPGATEAMECQYHKRDSFERQPDCDCGTGGFACRLETCAPIAPTGAGRYDSDGDGKYDYYKMTDVEGNEYFIFWVSRHSPYNAYDTLARRGDATWTDESRAFPQSSMAGSTCIF